MILVVVESPYSGNTELNVSYARAALADCLRRGEAPFASHLLYTQPGVLRDDVPGERQLGIEAGLSWGRAAARTVVYGDLGITPGMVAGIERAIAEGRLVEVRSLGVEWKTWPHVPFCDTCGHVTVRSGSTFKCLNCGNAMGCS